MYTDIHNWDFKELDEVTASLLCCDFEVQSIPEIYVVFIALF